MTRQIAPGWGNPSRAELEERILRLEERVALLARAVERLARLLEAHDTTGDAR